MAHKGTVSSEFDCSDRRCACCSAQSRIGGRWRAHRRSHFQRPRSSVPFFIIVRTQRAKSTGSAPMWPMASRGPESQQHMEPADGAFHHSRQRQGPDTKVGIHNWGRCFPPLAPWMVTPFTSPTRAAISSRFRRRAGVSSVSFERKEKRGCLGMSTIRGF